MFDIICFVNCHLLPNLCFNPKFIQNRNHSGTVSFQKTSKNRTHSSTVSFKKDM